MESFRYGLFGSGIPDLEVVYIKPPCICKSGDDREF